MNIIDLILIILTALIAFGLGALFGSWRMCCWYNKQPDYEPDEHEELHFHQRRHANGKERNSSNKR